MHVSKGPEMVTVPNLVGKTLDAAQQQLQAAGFEVDTQSYLPGRLVRAQSPGGRTPASTRARRSHCSSDLSDRRLVSGRPWTRGFGRWVHWTAGSPIITGAGRGLGREHALLFASEGAKVVVNDLGGDQQGGGADATPAQQTVDDIRAMGGEAVVNGDNVADWDGARRLVEQASTRSATCTCS